MEVKVCTPQNVGQAYKIRMTVFVSEQKVPPEIEMDDKDSISTHVLCCENGEPIGCGRFYITEENNAHFGRICVLKQHRGKGAGKAICDYMVALASEKGCKAAELNSQLHAVNFYKKSGFKEVGEPFYEAGIEHIAMIRNLK